MTKNKLEFSETICYEKTDKNTNMKKAINKLNLSESIEKHLWTAKGETELVECLSEEQFTQAIAVIIEIAEMCHVSTDYILGLTNTSDQNWTENSPYITHLYE